MRRLSELAAPDLAQPATGTGLGVLAVGSGVALMAAAAWLISAAALQPALFTLTTAIVAVRAFAIGRAGFRYAERLVSHDFAVRLLARIRVLAYRRLGRTDPAGQELRDRNRAGRRPRFPVRRTSRLGLAGGRRGGGAVGRLGGH